MKIGEILNSNPDISDYELKNQIDEYLEDIKLEYDEYKQEVFKNYIPDILDYLTTMMENPMFNPSNNYLSSTFALLIDFGEIYKKYIFKKLNDYTLQRLFQLANDSNDDDIIQLKD